MESLVDALTIQYFDALDSNKVGKIQAQDAAIFLRSSGIQDMDLAVIWDLSDRQKVGFLTLPDLGVAMKLVALVQNGHRPTIDNLKINVPKGVFKGYALPADRSTPDRVGTPPTRPTRPALPDKATSGIDGWVVSPTQKTQYDSIFYSLNPVNGKLTGNQVKPILVKSQLHVNVLGQIWELSDVDKDGQLDIDEFSLAMHLLNKAREGEAPPTVLPHNYIPPSHRVVYTKVQKVNWAVPPSIRKQAGNEFRAMDVHKLGVLSGPDLRPLLVRTGVPMMVLAKVWALCDINETGKLSEDQYALALFLINLHNSALPIPDTLTVEMIPPSLRSVPPVAAAAATTVSPPPDFGSPRLPPRSVPGLPSKTATLPPQTNLKQFYPPQSTVDKTATLAAFPKRSLTPPSVSSVAPSVLASIPDELASLNLGSALDNADFSVIKELDTYTKETDNLTVEKKQLQCDIKETESKLSSTGSELSDLKKQLVRLEGEVEVLRKKREDMQSRVDEADAERRKYEELIADMHKRAMSERQQISVLQQQIASQDALRKSQEEELQKTRDELTKLRQAESHYLHQVESGKRQLDTLIQNLRTIQSDTNLTQSKLVQIEAAHRTLDKALAELAPFGRRGPGMEGKPSILTNIHEVTQLRKQEQDVTQMSDITRATAGSSPISSMSGFSVDSYVDTHFEKHNPFGAPADPFQADVDPFGVTDPFKTKGSNPSKNGDSASVSSGVDVVEENGIVKSASNTPQLHRKHQGSADSTTLKTDEEEENDPFKSTGGSSDPFTNPFAAISGDDPFKSSGFSSDPFASTSDPFAGSAVDPFGGNVFKTVTNDPFSIKPGNDPFSDMNLSTNDPFASPKTPAGEEDDPFKEKNLFNSEEDAFNTHDPFANTPDPFAGSTDLFKGSNTSLSSRGNRGSKNSLNNVKSFGSKNSLRDSKSSLNESAVSDQSFSASASSADKSTEPDNFKFVVPTIEQSKDGDVGVSSVAPFKSSDPVDPFASNSNDPFKGFGDDPFATNNDGSDPFASNNGGPNDPFDSKPDSNDPFASTSGDDPFAAKFNENDPFSSGKTTSTDPFSTDPFQETDDSIGGAFAAQFS